MELRLEGWYRFRARLFHSLSLNPDDADSEGTRHFFDQRLRLAPQLRIHPSVHIFMDFDVLDLAKMAGASEQLTAAGTSNGTGTPFTEPLALSDSIIPGDDYKESLFVRRAWAELYTGWVDIKVGRMGSHFGMGLLANDGNCETCEHGDTVDRVMISTSKIDPVRISLAVDMRSEGFVNRNDDTHSFLLTGGYLGEVHKVGAWVRWTRRPSQSSNVVHADIWGATRLGPLSAQLEAVLTWAKLGQTDIGVEDLQVLSGGGALEAALTIHPWEVGLELGMASGDGNPTDTEWHAFSFDRDHDIALILFEEPMPVFARGDAADEANANLDTSRVLTGDAVSNAFYLRPRFHADVRENLRLFVNVAAAFPLVPKAWPGEPKAYGVEFDFGARLTFARAFELSGTAALFLPGDVYGTGLPPVFGGELKAFIHF
jgi:hypothetical protein